jgi:sugar lactone lactonase YvrE
MDSHGNVYYTDLKQVWRIAPDGTKTVAVPNVHTHELYLDAQDNLYGEHLWYEGDATKKWGHRVWRLSPDRKLIDVIPARSGFRDDYEDFSFVRDRAGNMYWAARGEHTVIRMRTPDGRPRDLSHNAKFHDVRWITASPEGIVYLMDDAELKRVGTDGIVTTVAGGNLRERIATQFFVEERHAVMGMWLDREGSVYLACYGARKVKKVTSDRKVSVIAETSFPWSPTGGMFAPNGDLWLLEYSVTNAVRARRIAQDGASHTF